MDINEWMKTSLPAVVDKLERGIHEDFSVIADDALNLAGRADIYELLDMILAALFPGCFSRESVRKGDIQFFLNDILRHVAYKLGTHLREVFRYRCNRENCRNCNCEKRAEEALVQLIETLPNIRKLLLGDIDAAFRGDPAAKSHDEILFSYPSVEAIATHRIAHELYLREVPLIPRIMSERAHSHTGIDIHPGARIGPRFFIDHGTGVVIGETTTIGKNVKVYQGVTLGALSPFDKNGNPAKGVKRHPDVEDDVIIYANATILGGSTVIGRGAVIGANTWVSKSVPPGAVVGQRILPKFSSREPPYAIDLEKAQGYPGRYLESRPARP